MTVAFFFTHLDDHTHSRHSVHFTMQQHLYFEQCASTQTSAHMMTKTQMYTEHLVHTLMTTALPYRDSLRYISPSKLPALPRERLPQYLLQHFLSTTKCLSLPIMRAKENLAKTFQFRLIGLVRRSEFVIWLMNSQAVPWRARADLAILMFITAPIN